MEGEFKITGECPVIGCCRKVSYKLRDGIESDRAQGRWASIVIQAQELSQKPTAFLCEDHRMWDFLRIDEPEE